MTRTWPRRSPQSAPHRLHQNAPPFIRLIRKAGPHRLQLPAPSFDVGGDSPPEGTTSGSAKNCQMVMIAMT